MLLHCCELQRKLCWFPRPHAAVLGQTGGDGSTATIFAKPPINESQPSDRVGPRPNRSGTVVTPVRHPGDQRPPCTKAFAQRAFSYYRCCFHVSHYISLPSSEGFLPPPQARSAGIASIWHTMEAAASYVKDGDDLRDTELRLGLPGTEAPEKPAAPSTRGSKRALQEDGDMESRAKSRPLEVDCGEAPAAK